MVNSTPPRGVIVIMSDEHNPKVMACAGHPVIHTPHLDALAARGQEVPRDAFGHVKLDAVNPGKWFGEQFAKMIGAEKVLVQKSGYFARSGVVATCITAPPGRC